jgi:hypothetical protein
VVAVLQRQRLLPWPWLLLHSWHLVNGDDDEDDAVVVASNTDDIVDGPALPRLLLDLVVVADAADAAAAMPCLGHDVRAVACSRSPPLSDVAVAGAADVDVEGVGAANGVGHVVDDPPDAALVVVVVVVAVTEVRVGVPLVLHRLLLHRMVVVVLFAFYWRLVSWEGEADRLRVRVAP